MDIRSGQAYPAGALSNFAVHPFVFDGVTCASMEGLLQSFKFDKVPVQEVVCQMVGRQAKSRGSKRSATWKQKQVLWWKGIAYPRDGEEYQRLLDHAYQAMYDGSESFRKALAATNRAVLTHSMGERKVNNTVLTEQEFCSRLMRLRDGNRLAPLGAVWTIPSNSSDTPDVPSNGRNEDAPAPCPNVHRSRTMR